MTMHGVQVGGCFAARGVALLLGLTALGCASTAKGRASSHAAARAKDLAELPASAPPLYREVLEFLWAEHDRDAQRNARGGASSEPHLIWDSPPWNKTLTRDKSLAERKESLARQLLALEFTGDFADDLLLDRVREHFFHATSMPAGPGWDARVKRFSVRALPLEVLRYYSATRRRARAGEWLDPDGYARSFQSDCKGVGRIYANVRALPPNATFAMAARKLLGSRQLEPGLFEVAGAPDYHCVPLVYAELARMAKAELARAPGAEAAPMPENLAQLNEVLGREPDPLLRDTYAWLLGVVRDAGGLDEEPLRAAGLGAGETGRRLRAVADLTSSFVTKVAKERAVEPWSALVARGLERSLTNPYHDDFPALMALLLLWEARPEAAAPGVTKALETRLEPWNGKSGFPARRFLPWAATRLSAKPGEVLAELLPLDWLAMEAPGTGYSLLDDRTREGSVRNVDGSLPEPEPLRSLRRARLEREFQALRSAMPAGSAASAVLSWLSARGEAKVGLDGVIPSGLTRCVKGAEYRVVPPAPDVLAFHVTSEDLTPRVSGSDVRPTAATAEAARTRLLIRALEQELEQVEIASDYASYVSARAARLKAADDSYRWGMETAQDRNVDAAYEKVKETTAGAASWADAERERIGRELAALRAKARPAGSQKESAVFTAAGKAQLNITLGPRSFGTWSEPIFFKGFDEEEVGKKAAAKQSEFLCRTLRREYDLHTRHLSTLLDGLAPRADSAAEKAAVDFAGKRSVGTLSTFLRALP